MTTETLTGRAEELLSALKQHANWMNRGELADATGKRNLSPHDRNLLDDMARSGLIEIGKQPGGGPRGFQYLYRIAPDASKGGVL